MNGAVFRARGLPIEEGVGNSWNGVSGWGELRAILVRAVVLRTISWHAQKEPVGASLLAIAVYQWHQC
ncbi:hypothetical protein ACEI36_28235 [Pseudomonas kielensis]|uniref:hypothetical protein n=1 Tax=Pseudomonas kielensis TaxID=2762577 RepID=UPI00389DD9D9